MIKKSMQKINDKNGKILRKKEEETSKNG